VGCVGEGHCYVVGLREVVGNVVFVLDHLEVAANTFLTAEALRTRGRFVDADAKYDEVFLTQVCIGYIGVVSVDILYNCVNCCDT
jgi:hypothetical protein